MHMGSPRGRSVLHVKKFGGAIQKSKMLLMDRKHYIRNYRN